MAMRVAWHSSGTYDANDGTGGSGTPITDSYSLTLSCNATLLVMLHVHNRCVEQSLPPSPSLTIVITPCCSSSFNNNNSFTDGGTMRFKQEASDPANAGLSIIRDMLHPVASANPSISSADLWTAGKSSVSVCHQRGVALNHTNSISASQHVRD